MFVFGELACYSACDGILTFNDSPEGAAIKAAKNVMADNVLELVEQAQAGDGDALAKLFTQYKRQLRTMIALRMDNNLKGRVDPSDILQDAWVNVVRKLPNYDSDKMSFFVWLRLVTTDQIITSHRQHIGAQKRDAGRELRRQHLNATSLSLGNFFVDKYTSVVGRAIKAEQQARLHAALDQMEDCDREIIAMRIFEGMSNAETAESLEITTNAASKRFIKAVGKIRNELKDLQGLF